MCIAASFALSLFVVAAELQVGDKVVTLTTAPLMNGREKAVELEPSVELTVAGVKLPWVGVSGTLDGKKVNGWVLNTDIIHDPVSALRKMCSGYDVPVRKPDEKYQQLDKYGDGVVTLDEFIDQTKLESLDKLNLRLKTIWGDGEWTAIEQFKKRHDLMLAVAQFYKWKREFRDLDEITQLTKDFLRSGDIRRSRLAQELQDREDPKVRAQRAEALFRWADRDGDGNLSLDEFKQGLPQAD